MPIKLNISEKGKAWKLEIPEEVLSGKSIGDKFDSKEIKPELEGYELEITGGSDNAGFPLSKNVEGLGLKGVILSKGWGMKDSTEGIRRKKTVRGKVVSGTTSQLNIKVLKAGKKPLGEVFSEQIKSETPAEKPAEQKAESDSKGKVTSQETAGVIDKEEKK